MLKFLIILIITFDYGIGEREIGKLLLNFVVNSKITDICATNYKCSKMVTYAMYNTEMIKSYLRFQFRMLSIMDT